MFNLVCFDFKIYSELNLELVILKATDLQAVCLQSYSTKTYRQIVSGNSTKIEVDKFLYPWLLT